MTTQSLLVVNQDTPGFRRLPLWLPRHRIMALYRTLPLNRGRSCFPLIKPILGMYCLFVSCIQKTSTQIRRAGRFGMLLCVCLSHDIEATMQVELCHKYGVTEIPRVVDSLISLSRVFLLNVEARITDHLWPFSRLQLLALDSSHSSFEPLKYPC